MRPQLENRVALITGGGSGIGQATALAFAREGARLAILDVDPAGGAETVDLVLDRGGEATFFEADVVEGEAVATVIQAIVARYGRLDCAVNNAGIEGEPLRTADATEADFDRIMAVNVKGVWLCLKYEIRQMLRQGGGTIVNTASVAGLVGAHSLPLYAASKHAVVGLTRSAAVEYARKGIRINAVCPAVIATPMVERGFARLPQFVDASIANNPSRRLGQAEEVAAAILWLCSDASSFTNGATLTVDGGLTAL